MERDDPLHEGDALAKDLDRNKITNGKYLDNAELEFRAWVFLQLQWGLSWTEGLPAVPNPLPHTAHSKTVTKWKCTFLGFIWFLPQWRFTSYKVTVPLEAKPLNPDSKVWTDPKSHSNDDFTKKYHPGAVYELRSRPISNGAGQQACYDAEFKLITTSPGWGSMDRASPCAKYFGTYNLFNVRNHITNDVDPFNSAWLLDGEKTGGIHVAIYMTHRPPSI